MCCDVEFVSKPARLAGAGFFAPLEFDTGLTKSYSNHVPLIFISIYLCTAFYGLIE